MTFRQIPCRAPSETAHPNELGYAPVEAGLAPVARLAQPLEVGKGEGPEQGVVAQGAGNDDRQLVVKLPLRDPRTPGRASSVSAGERGRWAHGMP